MNGEKSKVRTFYDEIARAKISDVRNIIISSCSKGGFTMAQQLEVNEDGKSSTNIFMKGAFHIDDLQGLYNLRDAINMCINKVEN